MDLSALTSLTGGGGLDTSSGINDGYTTQTLGARFGNNTITKTAINVPNWAWVLFACVALLAAWFKWGKK